MNPMIIMQKLFGTKAQEMLNKWQSMTPEQKQQEMMKVQNMTKEQINQYLQQFGFDINSLQQNQSTNTDRKFNY